MDLLPGCSDEQTPFLTPHEVSGLLKESVYTVRRWIKDGELPAYKVGRSWRISESDLDRWLRQQRLVVPSEGEASGVRG